MSRLPNDWDRSIPEALWAETLISAVRADVRALASPRVIATLERWREDAHRPESSQRAREAKLRLFALSRALIGVEATDPEQLATPAAEDVFENSGIGDAFTADAFSPDSFTNDAHSSETVSADAFSSNGRHDAVRSTVAMEDSSRSGAAAELPSLAPRSELADDDILEAAPARARAPITGSAHPSEREFPEDDEKPTSLQLSETNAGRSLGTGAAVDPTVGDENPTAAFLVPERLQRRPDSEDASGSDPSLFRTQEPQLEEVPRPPHTIRPKPGVVRRNAGHSLRGERTRPRAAMQQVKALHAVLLPLCEELMPLSVERRSRRFWARWREVAGDRGVGREFVEDLLYAAIDVRGLLCELIAEVQAVDPKSVYALVDRIQAEASEQNGTGARPGAMPDRQRGPMAGASVRVEGVPPSDDES